MKRFLGIHGFFILLSSFFISPVWAGVLDASLRSSGRDNQIAALKQETLVLRGKGIFRYMGVRLYEAFLYVGAGVEPLSETPRKLVIRYDRVIPKDAIIQAAEKNLKNNPEVHFLEIKDRVDRLHRAYVSVKKGDEYSLVYRSGKTVLFYNQKPLVEVQGADFAKAYFSIWLSKYSINQKLRKELIGEPR